MFDCGGKVDTLSFNRRKNLKRLYQENENTIKEALDYLRLGFKEKNNRYIGKACVMSAYANQKYYIKAIRRYHDNIRRLSGNRCKCCSQWHCHWCII